MSPSPTATLTAHLGELAETLSNLRRRFRQAARVEVARAVGEALRDVAQDLICGPARAAPVSRAGYTHWDDDPWHEPARDPWQAGYADPEEDVRDDDAPTRSSPLEPAVVVALAVARWGFLRTGQLVPAALIGLLVGFAAYAGGPAAEALLGAWSAANELLTFPGTRRE